LVHAKTIVRLTIALVAAKMLRLVLPTEPVTS